MKDEVVSMTIEADSSLQAGGAHTQSRYYIFRYPAALAATHNICQLEAVNYLVAVRAFVGEQQRGQTIEIIGDNGGAIAALSTGRAVDVVLATVARALWFHAAKTDVHLVFTHRNGSEIQGADALSRATLSHLHRERAQQFIEAEKLSRIKVFQSYSNNSK